MSDEKPDECKDVKNGLRCSCCVAKDAEIEKLRAERDAAFAEGARMFEALGKIGKWAKEDRETWGITLDNIEVEAAQARARIAEGKP